jgi:hypothetical protein
MWGLDVSQPYESPRPVTGIDLLIILIILIIIIIIIIIIATNIILVACPTSIDNLVPSTNLNYYTKVNVDLMTSQFKTLKAKKKKLGRGISEPFETKEL